MPTSAQQSMATIDQFLQKVGSVKVAEDPLSEPGSIGGETSHPVKKVDDRLQTATEGARSSENSKDVKEDQGAPSVENAPEAKAASARNAANRLAKGQQKRAEGGAVMTAGSAADDAEESVLNVQPTGEDPANETNSAKGGKEDPGSDHPARTDNDSLDGHKYAFDQSTPLEKMAGMFKDLGENLCAQIAWMSNNPQTQQQATKRAGAQSVQQKQAGQQPQYDDSYLAAQAGWELAGLINGTLDKAAADRMVENAIEDIIKTASDDADRTAAYFNHYFPQLFKQAEGEGGMPPEAGGGPPPGGEGGGGGPSEEEMMAMLGGGAPAGGEGGGPPPGGGGGGGGAPEEEAAQLAQVLEQLGVSPEELEQAMAEEAGGGAGGPPPGGDPMAAMAGGGAPPPGGGGPPGMEVAANDRFGRGRQTQPQQGEKVAQMRQYISEVIQRSRARR